MIKADCRDNLTKHDFEFIVDTLASDAKNKTALEKLLADQDIRDDVLDQDVLFRKIVQKNRVTHISPYLYFYVLTRHCFTHSNLEDRNLADYVASMLTAFCSAKRLQTISRKHDREYHYLVDILTDFAEASTREAFLLRSHLGNYALFMTGVFPDFLYRKSTYGRKAPGIDYYERMGRSSFDWASKHSLAARYRLVDILANLAQRFRQVRIALNRLTDDYLNLDETPLSLDKVLRKIFYGQKGRERNDS
ncbi:MAG: hypothetical protein ACE5IR_23525 [bacterium]